MRLSNEIQFYFSLVVALMAHFMIAAIWGNNMLPKVSTEIPFRVVNIKLMPAPRVKNTDKKPEVETTQVSLGTTEQKAAEEKKPEINLNKTEEKPHEDITKV